MKNAMKKLMAFALVAVMLVGALPFAASATEGGTWDLKICIAGTTKETHTHATKVPVETVTIGACLNLAQADLGIDPALFDHAFVVVGNNAGRDYSNTTDAFVMDGNTVVTIALKEPEPDPVYVSFNVDYGNGTIKRFENKKVGDIIGTDVLPANGGGRAGYEFTGYMMNGSTIEAGWKYWETMNGQTIIGNWTLNGCPECGWPTANGHADDCDLNPNKETQAPSDGNEGTQTPDATGVAYLNIFVNNTKVIKQFSGYTTEGQPGETVSVAACINLAGATNVDSVALNGAPIAQNATFTLGAAGSTTNISIATKSTSGSNSGSSTDTDTDTDTNTSGKKATAYIYVGDNDLYSTKYEYDYAFSIAQIIEKFDDNDTSRHYAFNYYLKNGSSKFFYEDNDVVQLGETVHIRLKVTESKLNHNKVYLQIFLNNDFDVPAKTLNVTTMASEDGLNLYGNVEDLILDYFTAKNSTGIKMDGMYESEGSWVADFLEDDKVTKRTADQIIEAKEDTFVVYNIMVTNAKLASSSSSTADSTNPKTGDQIFAPVAILTTSACALAVVAFILNKKYAVK